MIHLGLLFSLMMVLVGVLQCMQEFVSGRLGRHTLWSELNSHQLDCVGLTFAGLILTIATFLLKI